MGDINWDKLDTKNMGTRRSPARKLMESLGLKRRKRTTAQTATKAMAVAQGRAKATSK